MQDCAWITTLQSIRCITEWLKLVMIWLKKLPSRLSLDFENDYHKGTHEKGPISHFIIFIATIMEKSVIFVLRIGEQSDELPDELVNHCQIQRSEIVIKCIVN